MTNTELSLAALVIGLIGFGGGSFAVGRLFVRKELCKQVHLDLGDRFKKLEDTQSKLFDKIDEIKDLIVRRNKGGQG